MSLLHAFGMDVGCSDAPCTVVQAKFSLEGSPRLLPLRVFAWDANCISRRFRDCKNGAGFCALWKRIVAPKLSPDGLFAADASEVESGNSQKEHSPCSLPLQSRKRPSTSLSPPALMPVVKIARPDSMDETDSEMDRKIQDHFVGEYVSYSGNVAHYA